MRFLRGGSTDLTCPRVGLVITDTLVTSIAGAMRQFVTDHASDTAESGVITKIGTRQFGFAIHATTDQARLDFRRDYRALHYERIGVPGDVAAGVGALMAELGLAFAAIDFVVRTDGQWVFIGDVNPGGQYGWLEAATGVPLTDALADLLAHGPVPGAPTTGAST